MYPVVSDDQVREALGKIQEQRHDGTIPEFNGFGDNNWRNSDKQIELMEKYLSGELSYSDLELLYNNADAESSDYEPISTVLGFLDGDIPLDEFGW